MMPTRSRLFVTDEELGKRDDDHKPGSKPLWSRPVHKWRKRRVFGFLALCGLAFLFIRNLPEGLGPVNERMDRLRGSNGKRPTGLDPGIHGGNDHYSGMAAPADPAVSPPADEQKANAPAQNYEGPIRFYYLASSLHGISRTMGHRETNRNVLFAAADLKSAAALIPLACEMGRWDQNFVHFALMGRDASTLDQIKQINGATEDTCNVFWHDGRPDYALYSNDKRMENSVAGALGHIEKFMHPQAIVTTDSATEDDFFTRGIRKKAKELHLTLIAVPHEPERLSWLTRLDARALNAWHTASIDVIVQAPLEASGSLIRLLQSLEKADYAGFLPPRLTIELPHKIDPVTQEYLENFEWPPVRYTSRYSHGQNQQLILRRRIPEHKVNADEASTRFIESFYPSDPKGSHVFVLSSQAELSPVYYHYLKYHLLQYRYSSAVTVGSSNLIGISLESPSVYLNGTEAFEAPPAPPLSGAAENDPEIKAVRPFLWQAPNSNAALYFSREWMEVHSYLSKRQTATRDARTRPYLKKKKKEVSGKSPAWMEYFLELMRARGYFMLYPGLLTHRSSSDPFAAESLVIVHNDLYQPPEEFTHKSTEDPVEIETNPPETISEESILVAADTTYLSSHHSSMADHSDTLNHERPLLHSLVPILSPPPPARRQGNERALPPSYDIKHMTLLDFKGQRTFATDLAEDAEVVAANFRREGGACPASKVVEDDDHSRGTASDLFCITETHDDEEDEEEDLVYIPKSRPDSGSSQQSDDVPHFLPSDGRKMTDLEEALAKEYSEQTGAPGRYPGSSRGKSDHAASEDNPAELKPGMLDSWAETIRHAAAGVENWAHNHLPETRPPGKEGDGLSKDEDDTSEEWARERAEFLAQNQRQGPLRPPPPPANPGVTRGDMAGWDADGGLDERTGQPLAPQPIADKEAYKPAAPPADEEAKPFRPVRTDRDPVSPGSRQEAAAPPGEEARPFRRVSTGGDPPSGSRPPGSRQEAAAPVGEESRSFRRISTDENPNLQRPAREAPPPVVGEEARPFRRFNTDGDAPPQAAGAAAGHAGVQQQPNRGAAEHQEEPPVRHGRISGWGDAQRHPVDPDIPHDE